MSKMEQSHSNPILIPYLQLNSRRTTAAHRAGNRKTVSCFFAPIFKPNRAITRKIFRFVRRFSKSSVLPGEKGKMSWQKNI